jgi:hypothetical protein
MPTSQTNLSPTDNGQRPLAQGWGMELGQSIKDGEEYDEKQQVITDKYKDAAGSALALYSYPSGVGSDDQPHWLKIKIRVREQNSQYAEGETTGTVYNATNEGKIDYADNLTTGSIVGGVSGFDTADEPEVTSLITAGKLFGAVRGAAIGATAAALIGENKLYTLSAVIGLGIQSPPEVKYGAKWEEQDMGSMLGGGQQSSSDIAKGLAYEAYKRSLNPGKLGGALDIDPANAVSAVEKSSGKIRNPYKEQIFRQVEFRDFTFQFSFLPDSIAEANRVINIIYILKRNMLPEMASNSFYLIYPSEFSLQYMYKSAPNMNIHQFGDCVLTSLSVKYGSQDFTTYRGSDGVPSEINISMTFREIVPINATRVKQEKL